MFWFIVRISVAFYAVVKIAYPLPLMFPAYIGRGVLMAPEAGKFCVDIVYVASNAGGVVITIELKEFIMIKSRWCPGGGAMALCTAGSQILMQLGFRRDMAGFTLVPCLWLQQHMRERMRVIGKPRPGMINMTGRTVLLQ